ncbi:MAG TPA: glycosyltransferase [Acidobacteriaceae bacterium]|nr:glycosyltransferase [Acidobacteriaceae bacterium]
MPPPRAPRIAYFPDSYHEVNGVAHTSRNFTAYARRHDIPMLCVRAGQTTRLLDPDGSIEALELGRSPLAVHLEKDLSFDPLFFRYSDFISATVRAFRPDVIHITGPSELGLFGAYFAHQLNVPLVASWHTNLHEYAARRMRWLSRHLGRAGTGTERIVEAAALHIASHLYRRAEALYAPNPTLCTLLERTTHRPCHLMQRGVDTDLFTPARRTRPPDDTEIGTPVLGYVGRLSVEKNVALLPKVDTQLRTLGITARWLIIGHGAEEEHLRSALPNAELPGVLRDEALAAAYANMDLLIFPSHTDTFGNVVLEALASGVPAIVTPDGGPAHILQSAAQSAMRSPIASASASCETCRAGQAIAPPLTPGRIADDEAFAAAIADVLHDPENRIAMRAAARTYAQRCSWDAVFDKVLGAYPTARIWSSRSP